MKTWRIRVTGQDGGRLRLGQAILRYLLCWMFLLPALALAEGLQLRGWPALGLTLLALLLPGVIMRFDADRQFLHDRLARTRLTAS